MNTSWYNTRAGKEWRILMQDMTNVSPGLENQSAEVFAITIASFCEISSNAVIGWIKNGVTPSIDNLQRTLDVYTRMMRYRPSKANLILEETRKFKQEVRAQPYQEDKIKRLVEFMKKNPNILDKLCKEYCEAPRVITARVTDFDVKSGKFHIHFYDFAKSNTAFMRERTNDFSDVKKLIENVSLKNQIANHIRNRNFVINLDLENSIKPFHNNQCFYD